MTATIDPAVIGRIADTLAALTHGDQVTSTTDRAAIAKAVGVLRGVATASKRCARCQQILPIRDFGGNQHRVDRRQSWCRGCKAADAAARRGGRRLPAPDGQLTVCICDPARPGTYGACRSCGHPVVATMTPRLQARMEEKYPPIRDQLILWPEPEAAAS